MDEIVYILNYLFVLLCSQRWFDVDDHQYLDNKLKENTEMIKFQLAELLMIYDGNYQLCIIDAFSS